MRQGQDTLFGAPRGGRDGQVDKVGLASGGQQKLLSSPSLSSLTAPSGRRRERAIPQRDRAANAARFLLREAGKGDAASCVLRSREAGVASCACEKAPARHTRFDRLAGRSVVCYTSPNGKQEGKAPVKPCPLLRLGGRQTACALWV